MLANTKNLLIVVLLFLSGCGYGLKGTQTGANLPLDIALVCDIREHTELCSQLKDEIKANGIRLDENSALTLSIKDSEYKKRAVALQAGGNAAEFRLALVVDYSINSGSDTPVNRLQQLEQYHYFLNDELNVLGKKREEDEAKLHLARLIAKRLVSSVSN